MRCPRRFYVPAIACPLRGGIFFQLPPPGGMLSLYLPLLYCVSRLRRVSSVVVALNRILCCLALVVYLECSYQLLLALLGEHCFYCVLGLVEL